MDHHFGVRAGAALTAGLEVTGGTSGSIVDKTSSTGGSFECLFLKLGYVGHLRYLGNAKRRWLRGTGSAKQLERSVVSGGRLDPRGSSRRRPGDATAAVCGGSADIGVLAFSRRELCVGYGPQCRAGAGYPDAAAGHSLRTGPSGEVLHKA